MKNTFKILAAAAALVAASSVSAIQIQGGVTLSLAPGALVNVDTVTDNVSFTASASGLYTGADALVTGGTMDFSGVTGSLVDYSDFAYNPFVTVNPIWSIIGTPSTQFALTSIFVVSESASEIVLTGMGVASMNGFDDTIGRWSFSADNSGGAFSFSSTATTVPDSGATVALLGLGLLGLVGVRRMRR